MEQAIAAGMERARVYGLLRPLAPSEERGGEEGGKIREMGPPDAFGVPLITRLTQIPLPSASSDRDCWFTRARRAGVTLYEPFGGGMCAGLEMALRCGLRVERYLYSDVDPAAREVAHHRVRCLRRAYPGTLPESAVRDTFDALPQDVYNVGSRELVRVVSSAEEENDATAWLVVAGWECQDLSPAGTGDGLAGARSRTFYPLLQIVGGLQHIRRARGLSEVAYLIENTAAQAYASASSASSEERELRRRCDTATLNDALGSPVVVDAALLGSGAHRLRNIWTNLADGRHVQAVLACMRRPSGAPDAQQLLDPGGHAVSRCVRVCPCPPFYDAGNVIGEPVRVLPTLVSMPGSRAFRVGNNGVVWRRIDHDADGIVTVADEPNADERERMLGYATGATTSPGTPEATRRAILGRCIDANMITGVFLVSVRLAEEGCFSSSMPVSSQHKRRRRNE